MPSEAGMHTHPVPAELWARATGKLQDGSSVSTSLTAQGGPLTMDFGWHNRDESSKIHKQMNAHTYVCPWMWKDLLEEYWVVLTLTIESFKSC